MISRIKAIFLHYFYEIARLDIIADLFFWPLIDILTWGLTIVWIQQHEQDPLLARLILTALILFQIFTRGAYDIAVHLIREFWHRNLVNLFATPLRLFEWIIGSMLLCLVKTVVGLTFGASLAYFLYGVNVFSMGFLFIPCSISLLISGWAIGLISASCIIRFGQRVGMLAWILPGAMLPLSAVFYPMNILPTWIQPIATLLPMPSLFNAVRQFLLEGAFPLPSLWHNMTLNAVFFLFAAVLFKITFERSRMRGLNRLE